MSMTIDRAECRTCRFWHDLEEQGGLGECRRHAPTPIQRDMDDPAVYIWLWPDTYTSDWCGEHQPDAAQT